MNTGWIILLVLWTGVGTKILFQKEINKFEYGVTWAALLIKLFFDAIQ